MEELNRAAAKITKLKPDWREWYESGQCLEEPYEAETRHVLEDIIQYILQMEKRLIDQPDEQEKQEWNRQVTELTGEGVYRKIMNDSCSILEIYSDMKVIRDKEEHIAAFLSDVMCHYSVFYTESVWRQDLYGINANAVRKAVRAMHRVVYTHAGSRFSRQMARKEFENVTGIREPYSEYYAELYEKYYDRLQRNYILDSMDRVEDKLDHLLAKAGR